MKPHTNYYFTSSENLAAMKHPELDLYTKVKTGSNFSIYVTSKWSKSLTSTFGNPKTPKYNIGDSFRIDGRILLVKKITPIFIDQDWTFRYDFDADKYRLEAQLIKESN